MLELSDNRCGNEQIFMKLSSGWTIDFGAFVQQLPYAAFWKDCRCIYQGCNQIFADSVGLASPIAIVGLSDDDLDLPVAQSALFRSLSEDTLAAGATRSCRETPSTPDGVMLERTLNITPVRSPDGVVIGLFGIAITVRATDQPSGNSAISSKLAHDLGQSLTVISGAAELSLMNLEEGNFDLAGLMRRLAMISEQTRQIVTLIQQGLDENTSCR